MEAGGQRDRDRCGRVPLVLPAGVDVDVGLAEDDGHRLRPGRAEWYEVGIHALGELDRLR
jgi:hypothetical protein